MKSKDEMGITISPTIRSATARLMMNMLETDWSLFSVLMACRTIPFPTAVRPLRKSRARPRMSLYG